MKSIFISIALIIIHIFSLSAEAEMVHTIFFENTDHELHVYRSSGKENGKTLLLIGGIQGDEPGGFLSADLYADLHLSKGNLIVVPRANFQSILLNRRKVNDDMNRKFAEDKKNNYETKVVKILKTLIVESDMLLNLHDGSGFFSEQWEGPDRNPKKYGQSIIADCEMFTPSGKDKPIPLGEMARSVIVEMNRKIDDESLKFHFNNHNTSKKDSAHKEQRKSATYYALYTCGIPAFGIETSKSLPLETKVLHHNLAINAFMGMLDIIPETPGINLEPPKLHYLVVSVNNSLPFVVKDQQTLYIKPGDTITTSHIEANYKRGLSADIIGCGTINDTQKKIEVTKPTRIVARKDYYPCGSIYLAFGGEMDKFARGVAVSENQTPGAHPYLFFKTRINDEERIFQNYGNATMEKGDRFELVDVITSIDDPSKLTVNFKGFVGDESKNTGEDRGYVIDTANDLWRHYSVDGKGNKYYVVVKSGEEPVGKLFIELSIRLDGDTG